MFYRYEIKNEENEEILYLFVDDKYEFAAFNNRNSNIQSKIKNYIKDMKIKFNGKKVVLVVGGVLIMLLLTYNPSINKKVSNDNLLSQTVIEEVIEKPIVIEEELIEEVVPEVEKKPVIKEEEKNINHPKVENKPIEKEVITPKKEESIVEEPVFKGTLVTVVRSSGIILQMELEEYLIGVVGGEMPASFNVEALKAQAVVARTYTLKRISEGKVLTDTEATQVYKDNSQLQALWGSGFNTYYNKVKNAVNSTNGEYITYNGKYIDAVYHSTRNGTTEDAVHVWGYNIPYLKSVNSSWDLNASTYLRTTTKSNEEILNIMGIDVTETSVIEVLERSGSNRINKIKIDENIYSGLDLYKKLGLRSRDFDLEVVDNVLNITTRGYGHGVGMSQYGANGMANAAYNYRVIINHYYTNVQVTSI